MLNVSPAFHAAISTFPRTMKATVEFDMTDVTAQGSATASANTSAPIGGDYQAVDGFTESKKWMSEENNFLQLDGSFFTPLKPTDPEFDSIGWWSGVISDASGNFTLTIPVLTITLTIPFNSNGISFNFSPLTNNYCTSLLVVTTDNLGHINTYGVYPNQANYFFNQPMVNIVSVVTTFYSTNNPFRRVHLAEVLFGEMFVWTGNNIFEVDLLEEQDPLGNTASPKELTTTIANNLNTFNIYNNYLQKKQLLKFFLSLIYSNGSSETITMGTYYLYNWRNDNNYLSSTLYARDLLDVMSGTIFNSYNYSGTPITLYDLIISILSDFAVQSGLNLEAQISTDLNSIYTTGILPILSHHDALMTVAQSGMAIIYMDRYNIIHVEQSVSMVAQNPMRFTAEIPLYMQETYPKISIQDKYNYFTINVYSNTTAGSPSTIYLGSLVVNGTISTWIKYTGPADATTCIAIVTGGYLVSANYYTNAAYITINAAGSVSISITGNSITSTTISSDLDIAGSQPTNEVDIDNPMVTDSVMATNILNWYAAECLNTYLYEVESWSDPSVEVGDIVLWDSQYLTGTKQAKMTRQEFRFSGTLSATLDGKGV